MAETVRPEDLVCVAVVATAHGVRGALRLRCYTEDPAGIAAYGPLYDRHGRRLFRLSIVGAAKGGVIARADGIADRNAAEALRGTGLYVPRAALPVPEEDEYYHADLVGLVAEDPRGRPLGRVRAIFDFGAGDVVEIVDERGRMLDVPFTREAVPAIDIAAGRMVVDPPDGLLDEVGTEAEP